MSLIEDLHAAHKARRARLWPEAPKGPGSKPFELLVAEKDDTIRKQSAMIEYLQGEINQLKGSIETLQWAVKANAPKAEQEDKKLPAPLPITVANIVTATCLHFSVSYGDMIGKRRTLEVCLPRQVAMYLAQKLTQRSMPYIGHRMGGRDHTTILHACRKIAALVAEGSPVTTDIAVIRSMLVTAEDHALAHDKTPREHAGSSA